VRLEHGHRLARLDQQGLLVTQPDQLPFDRGEAGVVPRRLADTSVDDQLGGLLGHLGIEVVLEHPQGCLLRPALAARRWTEGGAHRLILPESSRRLALPA
jgi:hypothetical protein